MINIINIFETN